MALVGDSGATAEPPTAGHGGSLAAERTVGAETATVIASIVVVFMSSDTEAFTL